MLRRTALKLAGAVGALGLGTGTIAADGGRAIDTPERRLVIENRTDKVCRTEVWVDGDVSLDDGRHYAGRDSAVDGKIVSVTDPHGSDKFRIDGPITRIRWDCDRPPRITLDGREIDPRDYADNGDDGDDHDGDRAGPSRLLLTSNDDNARFRVRFTGRSIGRRGTRVERYPPNRVVETRVLGRTEFRYEGRLSDLELQGTVDVDVTQQDADADDWWDDWW
ncbi:hypothetical protein [Haloarchaeobius sp. HRN-SO-5]|uniref:hypothetical protein n=1 Tax=Haloarchaeobius sp. HRN-SO-5 TaxID=3446118 RepID=UPI003EBBA295